MSGSEKNVDRDCMPRARFRQLVCIDEPWVADLISVSSDCYLTKPVSCGGVIAFRQPGLTKRHLVPVQIVTLEVGGSGPKRSSGACAPRAICECVRAPTWGEYSTKAVLVGWWWVNKRRHGNGEPCLGARAAAS